MSRSTERIIEDQVRLWQQRALSWKGGRRPVVVTVSRLPGSGGAVFARMLAEKLQLDLFDRELVHCIAESSHLSEALVSSLDERVRSELSQWLLMMERDRFLYPYQYLQHLSRVVGTIAKQGQAVIVGRGASFILAAGESLRILLVAPLEVRIRRVAEAHGLDPLEAKRRLLRTESDRSAFVKKYFHADMLDPNQYDLVFNTEQIPLQHAVEATLALLKARGQI
jgi:cytidylate kinase